MRSTTGLRLLFAAALVCTLVPTIVASSIPAPVCFVKSQKCCFKFVTCGFITKKVRVVVPCPFKKCEKVCRPECKLVPTKVPKKVCIDKKVEAGKTCTKTKVYEHGKLVWKEACKPKFVIKKVCETKIEIINKKVCTNVCKNVCKTVDALCEKFNVVQFIKYCPTLRCESFKTSGTSTKPADFVAKSGKTISVISGKRTIKH
eukprot:IDg1844t1